MKVLEELKKHYVTIAFFIGLIWAAFNLHQGYLDANEEILTKLNTTQQMALKSVIWNDSIPLTERTSACDVYLGAGYNSLTKKHCQEVLIKEG